MNIKWNHTGFTDLDEGSTIQMQVSWWVRLKYLWVRYILGRRPDPPGLFIIIEVKNNRMAVIEPAFQCYRCSLMVPWSLGCADEVPHVCDDCFEKEMACQPRSVLREHPSTPSR